MNDQPQEPIEGHYPVPPDLLGKTRHHDGFDRALQDALGQLHGQRDAQDNWGSESFRLTVEYAVMITVNPGSVGDYIAIIRPGG
jgi:hypothetical protein